MAKIPEDDDAPLLGDSQFELDSPDEIRKKPRPILFLAISLIFAGVLAASVLYLTESGPFEPPQQAETTTATPPAPAATGTVAPAPASEPAALPLPSPTTAEPPKEEPVAAATGKKGKAGKKSKAAKGKKKKKK